jgi:formate C-acetyltransferase
MTLLREPETRVASSFEELRTRLYDQFEEIAWETGDGSLPPAALEAALRGWIAAHPEQPRVLQKAHCYRLICERAQIALEPYDWYASKLNHANLLRRIGAEWKAELIGTADQPGPLFEPAEWFRVGYEVGLVKAELDTGHISPGWERLYAGGLAGLMAQVEQARQAAGQGATEAQRAFGEAVEIVYRATMALAERFATLAQRQAERYPEYAERMESVAAVCRQVPAGAPQTFHQALQFLLLMHELIEMEGEYVRSAGHFDRVYFPYYQRDLATGRLTPEMARELILFLWIKFHARTRGKANGKNFLFGGQDAAGNPIENELTYLALDAYEQLSAPDPKLSVRYLPGSSDRLYRRVAELVRKGLNSFVLMNDVPAVEALVRRGKPLEDARVYLPIGCYEPAVDGKEVGCTMNLTLNLAKAVEYALHDGLDPLSGRQMGLRTGDPRTFATFEMLRGATLTQLDYLLNHTVECIRAHERYWEQINPSPLIAGTIADCIARGQDVGEGGAIYNSTGCVGAALANTADSLLALKQAVYDEARWTMDEVLAALQVDFEGHEAMRQYLLNRVPKWGNDEPEVDALARQVADHYCATAHAQRNERGGGGQAALFTLDYQWRLGIKTGALPDGRKARQSLAPGVGSMPGRDRKGATALCRSVAKLDFNETPNGAVLDVSLHPTAVRGEEGLNAFVELIRSFFQQGGYALQFNIFDINTLRDAQRNPENYASLQIRVTGWSVFFTQLSRFEQDQFILRNTHCL